MSASIKSQDILILLHLLTQPEGWIQSEVAKTLLMNPAESCASNRVTNAAI